MSEDFNHLSIELFVKSDKKIESPLIQEGGKKKELGKLKKIKLNLTESITSVENLSATSESEESEYITKTIAKKFITKIEDIK